MYYMYKCILCADVFFVQMYSDRKLKFDTWTDDDCGRRQQLRGDSLGKKKKKKKKYSMNKNVIRNRNRIGNREQNEQQYR